MNQALLSKNNILWLQGAATMIIMISHYITEITVYPRFINIFESIGVSVFLLISGYLINEYYKRNGLTNFFSKLFKWIILPCWIITMMKLPFTDNFNLQQLLGNIIFFRNDVWFVDYIVKWYAVYWCTRKFLPQYTIWILASFAFISIFMQQLYAEQSFSFIAGYLISKHINIINKLNKKKILKYSLFSIIYGTLFILLKEIPLIREHKGTTLFNIILLNIKLPLATGLIVFPYIFPSIQKVKVISWVGIISFEISIIFICFTSYINNNINNVIIFSILSIIISIYFKIFNKWILNSKDFLRCIAIIIYLGTCYLLITKYAMREIPLFGYITIPYIILISFIYIYFIDKNKYKVLFEKKILLMILVFVSTTLFLIVQYHFDPLMNNVDRWSAISYPLRNLFNGEYPYLAKTHLGGYASPFPIWMVLHIPFYILGNVGLSEIFSTIIFIYSVKILGGNRAGIYATLLLIMSVNIWYEVSVRSDLISNFLLLSAFINILIAKDINFSNQPVLLAVIAGLWMSTRLTCIYPLFILFFPSWINLSFVKKIITPLIALSVFSLTFLPLVIWDSSPLLFSQYSPFVLQSRFGHIEDGIIIMIITAATAYYLNKFYSKYHLICLSGISVCSLALISFCHNMWIENSWTEIFNSRYDITYFNAALPFVITYASLYHHTRLSR